jgi:hypothetical protein
MRVAAALERGLADDRRRYARYQVQIGAGLSANIRPSTPITVVDLAVGGCGIEIGIHIEPGARVWLKLPGLEAWPCRIAWAAEGRAGLSFDQPLHQAVVDRFAPPAPGV